jgi:hypothetical protein
MLDTPHIWAWHRRHDDKEIHPRSLSSSKTMADFDPSPMADPHPNGTIWGAALWDLRTRLKFAQGDGVRQTDLLVLQALILLGKVVAQARKTDVRAMLSARESYATGLRALLHADELLNSGGCRDMILAALVQRGIPSRPGVEQGAGTELCFDVKS